MSESSSQPPVTELHRLASAAQIVELHPVGFSAALHGDWPGPDVDVTADVSTELKVHHRQGGFAILGRFSCKVHRAQESPRKPLATFRYDVMCTYEVGPEEFTPELLELFARTNGMVHLWPYFRHYVQTSGAQLNILPILLPPFRAHASRGDWERHEGLTANPDEQA